MAISEGKPRQFAFTLRDDELEMLRELAEADDRSAANWLRRMIREKHSEMMAACVTPISRQP